MFCQPQGSIENISGNLQKKRKLDLSDSTYIQDVQHFQQNNRVFHNIKNVQCTKTPSHVTQLSQNFIHASTIKLLDTYQRCGQKVIFLNTIF